MTKEASPRRWPARTTVSTAECMLVQLMAVSEIFFRCPLLRLLGARAPASREALVSASA